MSCNFSAGNNGKVFEKIYIDSSVGFSNKLTNAQRPGIHAEILVVDQLIKDMRNSGLAINSLDDLVSNGAKIMVKGKTLGQMVTCPHCHNILHKLNIVIND